MILGRSKPRSATSATHRQWVALVATLATLTWTSIVGISPELSLYHESRLASMAVYIPIEVLHSLVSNLRDLDKFIPLLSTYLPPGSAPLPASTNTHQVSFIGMIHSFNHFRKCLQICAPHPAQRPTLSLNSPNCLAQL